MKRQKQKRERVDDKIAKAKTDFEKMSLVEFGITEKELSSFPILVALFIYELKQNELFTDDYKKFKEGMDDKINTDDLGEWNRQYLFQFALQAMVAWKPEMFELLAKAMRRVEHGDVFTATLPGYDKLRAEIVRCKGNISAATLAKKLFPGQDNAARTIRRVIKRLYPKIEDK